MQSPARTSQGRTVPPGLPDDSVTDSGHIIGLGLSGSHNRPTVHAVSRAGPRSTPRRLSGVGGASAGPNHRTIYFADGSTRTMPREFNADGDALNAIDRRTVAFTSIVDHLPHFLTCH